MSHSRTHFAWWIARFAATMEKFDAVRIDHFLGFCRAWAIPAKAKTARRGKWLPGPGAQFFDAIRKKLGRLPIIAEDLGLLTPQAEKLRNSCGFPGMRVMQFAFGKDGDYHHPDNFPRRCVAYTGTHDNDTIRGWLSKCPRDERRRALKDLNATPREAHWKMIEMALASKADTVIFPVQDMLGLGSEARMNLPGVALGNWRWQLRAGVLNGKHSARLRKLTHTYGRNGK
jgi:4-alpha-glucanotransferase